MVLDPLYDQHAHSGPQVGCCDAIARWVGPETVDRSIKTMEWPGNCQGLVSRGDNAGYLGKVPLIHHIFWEGKCSNFWQLWRNKVFVKHYLLSVSCQCNAAMLTSGISSSEDKLPAYNTQHFIIRNDNIFQNKLNLRNLLYTKSISSVLTWDIQNKLFRKWGTLEASLFKKDYNDMK